MRGRQLLSQLAGARALLEKRVGELSKLETQRASVGRWTVAADETVANCTRKMVDNNVGALCVAREGKVVGIVTERDYLTKVLHEGRTSAATQVAEIATMGKKMIVASVDDTLQDCVDVMVLRKFRHLPVADGSGSIVGLLSIKDVTKELAADRIDRLYTAADLKTAHSMPIHDG